MINIHRLFLAACLACLLPFSVFSEVPVVDDSENFALLDEQQTAHERPVAHEQSRNMGNDEETPLANDDQYTTNNNGSNAALLDKFQGLQQEIQELRGQIDVQAHDLKLLQQQQLSFYKDLDARLRKEPAKLATTMPSSALPIDKTVEPKKNITPQESTLDKPTIAPAFNDTTRNNPADEQISYLAAYELIKNKRFDEAITSMQTFVIQHPQGGYTANAQYWLGELYIVKKDYPQAIDHFNVVLKQFPSSSKSAPSLLKIGYALAASGKKEEAIQKLQQVVKNYPDTNTAQLAKTKLDLLGHS